MISLKMKRTAISAAHEPIRRTILPTSRFCPFFALLFIHPHLLSTTNNSDSRPLFPVFSALHPPSWLDQSSATFRCQTCLLNYGESRSSGIAYMAFRSLRIFNRHTCTIAVVHTTCDTDVRVGRKKFFN